MEGYAKLSSLMATDTEFAIYRKFGALNAQNLLYYQAELMRLEEDLRETAVEDRRSQDSEKRLFSDNWFELSNAEPGKNLQFQKVMQIRRTLKEYNDCLIQQATIAKLDRPFAYNLKMLRRWLTHPAHGNSFLLDLEEHTWDKAYDKDFLAIPKPGDVDQDMLSQLFLGPCVAIYHKAVGRFYKKESAADTEGNFSMVRYNDSKVLGVASIVSTLISSALPIASIIALNYIDPVIIRLVVVALFTMTFSLVLSLMTNARRVEIFAATAAFAAVQVVFVGSTSPASSQPQ